MNPLPIIKTVVGTAAGIGAGTIVGNVVKATTPITVGPIKKVLIGLGSYALGSAAGALAAKAISNDFDDVEKWIAVVSEQTD